MKQAERYNNHPIGILDSGVGGLSVWREVIELLPRESTIYFADSKHCPYGSKSIPEITRLTTSMVEFLIKKNCKLILIACNTITVSIIEQLRSRYPVPLVAVEPATKVAAKKTRTQNIGILATGGTFKGDLYRSTKDKFTNYISVHFQTGDGLVEIVESGDIHQPKTRRLLKKYLTPFLDRQVDQLVLGCTHYPFLAPEIEKITGGKMFVINPAPAVARQVKRQLERLQLGASLSHKPGYIFYTSADFFPLEKLFPRENFKNVKVVKNIQP